MSASTDSESLRYYLELSGRRGEPLVGGHHGAAGGAACGDLIRISLIAAGGRIERTSSDAEGCATADEPDQ